MPGRIITRNVKKVIWGQKANDFFSAQGPKNRHSGEVLQFDPNTSNKKMRRLTRVSNPTKQCIQARLKERKALIKLKQAWKKSGVTPPAGYVSRAKKATPRRLNPNKKKLMSHW